MTGDGVVLGAGRERRRGGVVAVGGSHGGLRLCLCHGSLLSMGLPKPGILTEGSR
jgi:hypothetical protein